MSVPTAPGDLPWQPARERPDLLAPPVAAALSAWEHGGAVVVAAIDPAVADTAALVTAHAVPASACANCVVVAGRRGEAERLAACVVLATTRTDVNGLVRRALDARKASFAPQERAVAATGMEHGGITPVGLPGGWRLLVDAAVAAEPVVVVGSGLRRSKLALPGALVAALPGAEVVPGLGQPVPAA
ncbi:YbaK/EbsC family protein [Quadrisphaera sp. DSM 44207]|uniref:YbaK/EbsC family protein n=1 Tax=Quadrisphaera sp. DSM 44207 TaxID=1881057 RepID=UPI0008844009|nr:YbaK/EbsC family protein [Quadrisphaera sp. DSM 44207]SDQ43006.1 Cys-tRNA(Pro) deacylase, prolyl-tRNA editing enzyme YbaK/EbsC [Quadrisphaera sp. DSM 44207]